MDTIHAVPGLPALRLQKIAVRFPRPRVENLDVRVRDELARHRALFSARSTIAIAVGSRGVANLAQVVRTTVEVLTSWGVSPFIVPAMGSHGGATAEGQRQLLADYGVTAAAMGCPVQSDMAVTEVDRGALPHRIFMDAHAWAADGVLLINRIKPHTDFHGPFESGLAKMAVIGLGKERQAIEIHQFGVAGLRDGIPRAAAEILGTGKIVAGLALVENAYDETMMAELVPATALLAREPALLDVARANMPRLPVEDLDVLIVDQLGKNISGTGLDTNIIGRMRIAGEPEPEAPRIRTIVVTDLTDASHGNATGTGLADVITQRLFDKIDVKVTYTNVFTSGFPERGKIPIVAPTDRDAYACALRACGMMVPGAERVSRMRDTLHVGDLYVSPALLPDLQHLDAVSLVGDPVEAFEEDGRLRPF